MKQLALFLILAPALYLLAAPFVQEKTDGFTLVGIEADPAYTAESKEPPPGLFCERYSYLGSGGQCFAFLSEDGKTVLKLFRNYTQLPRVLFNKAGLAKGRSKRQKEKLERDLASYRLTANELREESGLLYLHLGPTCNQLPTVTLIDKLRIEHRLSLDNALFAVQQKAEPVYPYLDNLMEEGKRDEAVKALYSLVALLTGRQAKGIFDEDAKLHRNCGFVDGKAVYIDIGRFCYSTKQQSLKVMTSRLSDWLHDHHPELEGALADEVQKR